MTVGTVRMDWRRMPTYQFFAGDMMLNKLSIQRSLMWVIGLLMMAGMVGLTVTLVSMQRGSQQARQEQLSQFFSELSHSNQVSLDQMTAAVSGIIGSELDSIQAKQTEELVLHQKERASQLAQLISVFVAPYLDRNDDAEIDNVCRSAAYDSDIGVLVVEDDDGYYFGGYYREDHPGLVRRLSNDGEAIPFGPDRVARTLMESHSKTVYEERAPIYSSRDVTRRIGWIRLIMLNDRIVQEAERLAARAQILQSEATNSLASEANRLSEEQEALMEKTVREFRLEGEYSHWRLSRTTLLVILVVLVSSLTAIALISSRLLKPLQQATVFAASLGKGDLSRRMDPGNQYDAKRLILALNSMADALEERGVETQGALSELSQVLTRVNQIADRLDGGAQAIANSSQGFTAGYADLGDALKEIAKTMSDIESHSAHNADNASHVTTMSEKVLEKAREGRREMKMVTDSMNVVISVYARLTGMVKTIDDIAFQTNLLALNAAVEAAHAGRFGKGFSIVADEVRTLSLHSSKAAAEARQEVALADKQMEEAITRSRITAEALAAIAESAQDVSVALDTVKASSSEQLEGVRFATANMDRISTIAGQGIEEARSIASTTTMLSEMARQLKALLQKSIYRKNPDTPVKRKALPQTGGNRQIEAPDGNR